MQNLRVTIIQADLFWQDIEKNLQMFDGLIEGIVEETEIVLLPEMFTTGFSMDAVRLAQPMDGPAVSWMLEKAAVKKAVIAGSIICSENGASTTDSFGPRLTKGFFTMTSATSSG